MTLVKKRNPKQTLQTKRRFGEHHKKTKIYHKIYWPYLPLLIIAGLLVIGGFNIVLKNGTNFTNKQLVAEINNARISKQYQPIRINPDLDNLARVLIDQLKNTNSNKALGQVALNLRHTQSTYSDYGLNLAYGFKNNNYIVNGWLINSPDRQNILNPDYSQIGLATKTINFNHKYQRVVFAILAPNKDNNVILTPFVNYGSKSLNLSSAAALGIRFSKTYLFITLLLILIIAVILIFRNYKKIANYLKKGEKYLLKHFILDIVLILIIALLSIILFSIGKVI